MRYFAVFHCKMDEIKLIIKSLIVSSGKILTIEEIESDFYDVEGYKIPYRKMGFESACHFLRSLDGFRVKGYDFHATVTCAVSEQVRHIRKMVQEQNKPRRRDGKKPKRNTNFPNNTPLYSSNSGYSQTIQYSSEGYNSNGFYEAHRHIANKNDFKTHERPNRYDTSTDNRRYLKETSSGSNYGRNYSDDRSKYSNNASGGHQKYSCQVWNLGSIEKDKIFGRIARLSGNMIILKDRREEPKGAKSRNENLIEIKPNQNPSGTEIKGLKSNNSEKIQELRSTRSQGCQTESNKSFENFVPKTSCGTLVEKPQTAKAEKCQEALPDDAFTERIYDLDRIVTIVDSSKEDFKESAMWTKMKKGSYIKIFVSEVHSPYKFWFLIGSSEKCLQVLTNRMQSFYRNSVIAKAYAFPESYIVPGRVCVALFKDVWNRAKILSYPKNDKVKVFFVDYGTVDYAAVSELKHLTQEFISIPKQALRGSLINIEPVGSHWSLDASLYLMNAVCNKLLTARIAEINETTRTLHLMLLINKLLVAQGHAKLDLDGLQRKSPRENLPSFEMLESGEYPTLTRLRQYMSEGLDYEALVDEKIVEAISLKFARLEMS